MVVGSNSNTQLNNPNAEYSLLDLFFKKYNSGQMSSDLIYDVNQDKILHVSLDFKKLAGHQCKETFDQCILFIKSLIHPADYNEFLVEMIEFVKGEGSRTPENPYESMHSFCFRMKGTSGEWMKISFHALLLHSNKLVGVIQKNHWSKSEDLETGGHISAREKEILNLIADGDSAKIIGDKLNISPNTVITHRNNLKKKFNAKNTAELIKEAVKSQVI
ncbi:response regulator transcription factor [Mangrovibacterium lignilyticum]|uniref:response regulator transcription factor n=1 Tax=Mangrovibacterium lignilyticum TaxID=2668052 RepID=UPI0019672562|nr:helix-turn-helix transcriptional regulator [Mangrovibacterium lignilyticum]